MPEEVGEKVDREGVIRAKRIESFTRDHPEGEAVLADPAGAL